MALYDASELRDHFCRYKNALEDIPGLLAIAKQKATTTFNERKKVVSQALDLIWQYETKVPHELRTVVFDKDFGAERVALEGLDHELFLECQGKN